MPHSRKVSIKDGEKSSTRLGDASLHGDDDDFLRSQLRSSFTTKEHSGLGKTSLGSMDLLVLNTSDHGTVSLSHDIPIYCFESNSRHTPTKPSRLESKLSRHRPNDSIEYPADEVTVELSMTDDDVEGCNISANNERGPIDKCESNEKDEKKEPEMFGDYEINDSIVCSSQENFLENSRCNSSFLHSNDAVARAVNYSILNTSGISTIPTVSSEKIETSMAANPAITKSKRYNHYDWSYSEETPPRPGPQSSIRNSDSKGVENKKSFDDASTLATIAVSNTSMVATPDTSFESATLIVDSPASIEGKLPPSPSRKNRTSTSLRGTIEHDTLVVVEGSEETLEFRHSSLILQYASAELAKHFVESVPEEDIIVSGGEGAIQFVLNVRVQDASDWCILQPFLEPHAVQPAVVTPLNLPTLLPWFKQLYLNVLLKECDTQLMDHVSPPPKIKQTKRKYNTLSDEVVTLTNVLLIGRIAVAAGLQKTAKSAFTALSNWMEDRPDVWLQQSKDSTDLLLTALKLLLRCLITNDDESSKDSPAEVDSSMLSYDDLLDVWESMFEPLEAAYLFAAIITYLPADCVEDQQLIHLSNVRSFLCNPLLPYFLREGILMKQKKGLSESSDAPSSSTEAPAQSDSQLTASISDTRWTISDSTTSESNVELALAESPTSVAPIPRTTSVDSHDTSIHSTSHLLQVAEEWQAGWNSLWMKLAGTESRSEKTLWRSSSHANPERCPHEVSKWLQSVWKRLNDPPVFGPATDDLELVPKAPETPAVSRIRKPPISPKDRMRTSVMTSSPKDRTKLDVVPPSPAAVPSTSTSLRRTFAC